MVIWFIDDFNFPLTFSSKRKASIPKYSIKQAVRVCDNCIQTVMEEQRRFTLHNSAKK